ncbi:hypothetical protein [Methylocystis sp. S23]
MDAQKQRAPAAARPLNAGDRRRIGFSNAVVHPGTALFLFALSFFDDRENDAADNDRDPGRADQEPSLLAPRGGRLAVRREKIDASDEYDRKYVLSYLPSRNSRVKIPGGAAFGQSKFEGALIDGPTLASPVASRSASGGVDAY